MKLRLIVDYELRGGVMPCYGVSTPQEAAEVEDNIVQENLKRIVEIVCEELTDARVVLPGNEDVVATATFNIFEKFTPDAPSHQEKLERVKTLLRAVQHGGETG